MTGINTVGIGKITHTACSVDYGLPYNTQLALLTNSSIKNVLFFKKFKLIQTLTKRNARPRYLFSKVLFNKKYFFIRNRAIDKGKVRLYSASNQSILEPVIINRVALRGTRLHKPTPKALRHGHREPVVEFIYNKILSANFDNSSFGDLILF